MAGRVTSVKDECEPLAEVLGAYERYLLRVRAVNAETARRRRRYLERFAREAGAVELDGLLSCLTVAWLRSFVCRYGADRGRGACRWMWSSLRAFLGFGWHTGLLDRDLRGALPVVRRRRLDHVPRALTGEQILALDERIGTRTAADLRDQAIVGLLATYGVRGCQVQRLCLDDIDWEAGRLRFGSCRGSRAVEFALTVEAGNRLCAYLQRGRPPSDVPEVFLTLRSPFRPIGTPSQLSRVIHKRLDQAGIVTAEGVSRGCHGFRHALAKRLVGQVPFKYLVDILGHRDPSTTFIYSKVDEQALLDTALPWPEVVP